MSELKTEEDEDFYCVMRKPILDLKSVLYRRLEEIVEGLENGDFSLGDVSVSFRNGVYDYARLFGGSDPDLCSVRSRYVDCLAHDFNRSRKESKRSYDFWGVSD